MGNAGFLPNVRRGAMRKSGNLLSISIVLVVGMTKTPSVHG